MIIPCHAPSNVYSTRLAFAVALLQLWQLLTSAETTSDDRGLHMKNDFRSPASAMWSFQGPAKKNKKIMSKLSNALFHSVNPASDATLVLGRDPEMHRSQMDKTKTKQRREGEWCHLTCHSDSSTTQNRRIKSYETPSKDFSSTKRRWQRPKVAPQPLLAMNSHLTGTQIKSERKKAIF